MLYLVKLDGTQIEYYSFISYQVSMLFALPAPQSPHNPLFIVHTSNGRTNKLAGWKNKTNEDENVLVDEDMMRKNLETQFTEA